MGLYDRGEACLHLCPTVLRPWHVDVDFFAVLSSYFQIVSWNNWPPVEFKDSSGVSIFINLQTAKVKRSCRERKRVILNFLNPGLNCQFFGLEVTISLITVI